MVLGDGEEMSSPARANALDFELSWPACSRSRSSTPRLKRPVKRSADDSFLDDSTAHDVQADDARRNAFGPAISRRRSPIRSARMSSPPTSSATRSFAVGAFRSMARNRRGHGRSRADMAWCRLRLVGGAARRRRPDLDRRDARLLWLELERLIEARPDGHPGDRSDPDACKSTQRRRRPTRPCPRDRRRLPPRIDRRTRAFNDIPNRGPRHDPLSLEPRPRPYVAERSPPKRSTSSSTAARPTLQGRARSSRRGFRGCVSSRSLPMSRIRPPWR